MCDTTLLSGGDKSDKDSSEEDGEDEEMELSEERCFDDFLGDYVDCPEEESENKEEENEDGAVNGGDTVLFPLFEIPLMSYFFFLLETRHCRLLLLMKIKKMKQQINKKENIITYSYLNSKVIVEVISL